MQKRTARISLVFFLATVVLNYVCASGILPGFESQKVVSAANPSPITPAGFTFSIWGVIFGLLLVNLVYLVAVAGKIYSPPLEYNAPKLWLMFGANVLWNLLFCSGWVGLSTIAIGIYFVFLLLYVNAINTATVQFINASRINKFFFELLKVGFGLHLGWITLATVVNIFSAFEARSSVDLFRVGWVVFGVVLAVVTTVILTRNTNNPYVPLAAGWGLWGIYNSQYLVQFQDSFIPSMLLAFVGLLGVVFVIQISNLKRVRS